ncbi:MAG: hypothetical protein JJE25_03750 [Bacteroidia bacterium]|nr:hypothetical protein [Bacteroidia bacterium]
MSGRKLLLYLIIFLFIAGVAIDYFILRSEKITYSNHIAKIIYEKCTPCHRQGEVGIFPLVSYQDAERRAKMLAKVTREKTMPPWPADNNYQHYVGERYLTELEIKMISDWAENGAPLGDSTKAPPLPEFPTGSQLGKPDLVLKMKDVIPLPGDNKDKFMLVKIPYETEKDTFIHIIEFVPDNRRLVHHLNGHLIQYDFEKKKDVFSGATFAQEYVGIPQDELYKKINLLNDDGSYPTLTGSVFNYLPGVLPAIYPEGIGVYNMKRKGALLLKSIHYGPTPVDQSDQSTFNIFFSAKPPERPVRDMILGTYGVSQIEPPLVIPANEIKTFHTQVTLKMDISILTVNPHMHLLGKSFLAYALTPTGDTIRLIKIDQWDFRWQFFYSFKNIFRIPAGSVIHAFGTYDNTTENPYNPYNPPRIITEGSENEGMSTTSEMFQLIISYMPYKKGDENISLENGLKKLAADSQIKTD